MFVSDNKVGQLFGYLSSGLDGLYDERESLNVAQLCFLELLGLSRVDLVIKAEERLSESEILKIHHALKELKKGKPVQYVIGHTEFCGLSIQVNENVLIPRPETEELVQWIMDSCNSKFPSILDLCTGSGCIALALKNGIAGAHVRASDVSKPALDVAYKNSIELALEVQFHEGDILDGQPELQGLDIIVSNPPYIGDDERDSLHSRVLDHEPNIALISSGDTLKFYRSIAAYAATQLKPGGLLFFELTEKHAQEIAQVVELAGLGQVEVKKDINDRPRMLRAQKSAEA